MREWWYWNISRKVQLLPYHIAGWLPRWLVYHAAIRLVAFATTGKYGNTNVPELSAMDAIERWRTSNGKT